MSLMKIISRQIKKISSGKKAVVVLPYSSWKKLIDKFEEFEEMIEMSKSNSYLSSIKEARKSKRETSLKEVMERFGVV